MKERKAENRPVVRPGAVGWILEGAALLVLLADFSFTAWGTFALPEMPPEFFEFRGGGSMALLRAGSPRLSVCRSWMSIRCMRWRWLSW